MRCEVGPTWPPCIRLIPEYDSDFVVLDYLAQQLKEKDSLVGGGLLDMGKTVEVHLTLASVRAEELLARETPAQHEHEIDRDELKRQILGAALSRNLGLQPAPAPKPPWTPTK